MFNNAAAAAELALKSYIAEGTPEILSEIAGGPMMMQEIRAAVNLVETPEEAVCSLVADLMHYCQRERIDWPNEVLLPARARFSAERRSSRRR